jgi:hypothetical protein
VGAPRVRDARSRAARASLTAPTAPTNEPRSFTITRQLLFKELFVGTLVYAVEIIRERYLPEGRARTKAQHRKAEFAIRAAAMIRGGADPDLLGAVYWWRTDDLWLRCLDALIIYVRAAAERTSDPVATVCRRPQTATAST